MASPSQDPSRALEQLCHAAQGSSEGWQLCLPLTSHPHTGLHLVCRGDAASGVPADPVPASHLTLPIVPDLQAAAPAGPQGSVRSMAVAVGVGPPASPWALPVAGAAAFMLTHRGGARDTSQCQALCSGRDTELTTSGAGARL